MQAKAMTIEEAIDHAEAIAIDCELYENQDASSGVVWETRRACAAEHRQLAEWLRELQERRKQPEHKWIPCSERLPDSPKQVLVYARSVHYALAKYDEMREADGSYKKQWVTFDAWKPFYTIKEVIAWRPLLEPYAERRTDGQG